MLLAFTRAVPPSIGRCELTHLQRSPIDVERASAQHESYEAALEALGCTVRRLPPEPGMPDSVFVEDTAVVVPEVAVITRPGAPSRRGETAAVAEALRPYRTLETIEAPGTLDGGDVLRIGTRVYVGASGRSNRAGIGQLADRLGPRGYDVVPVPVEGCLHLKTAVASVTDELLLVNPDWVDPTVFLGMEHVGVHPDEPFAANALRTDVGVLYPTGAPRTLERIHAHGIVPVLVDMSELQKAEAGLTCSSLLVEVERPA